jgi:predicted choloylglycine hydrolase
MMNRREFIKASIGAPLILNSLSCNKNEGYMSYQSGDKRSFDLLEVKGSYQQVGYQIGHYFQKNIRTVLNRRSSWHENLMEILLSKKGRQLSEKYLQLTKKHFPHLLKEIQGMADGAGLDFDAIWAMCIKSELNAFDPEPIGCSTIYYEDKNNKWLFHNEDGHRAYDGQMFMIKVHPPSGVSYLYLVYPGIITGNGPGINSEGIFQTTNYISSTKSTIGIPRYILGRAVLESKSVTEATEIVTMEPRAYPYHHNIGSMKEGMYVSVETNPKRWKIEEPSGIYYHTNHFILGETKTYPFEDRKYKDTSSLSRYKVIQEELQHFNLENPQNSDIHKILTSHQKAPYSPCRHPKEEVTGQTLSSAWFDLKRGVFRLYKGNPCQALTNRQFIDYRFELF